MTRTGTGGDTRIDRRTFLLANLALATGVSAQSGAGRTFDLTTASIADINAAFDAGALTSERLTQLYLARIAAYDKSGPKLNAVLKINPNAGRKPGRWMGSAARRVRGVRCTGSPCCSRPTSMSRVGRPLRASTAFAIRWRRSMQSRPVVFAVPDA